MSSHTPGPWVAAGPAVKAPKAMGLPVAQCLKAATASASGRAVISEEEAAANARLIAAAPDMLVALVDAEEALAAEADIRGGHDEGYWHPIGHALKAVRAAISKAGGASS